MMIDTHDIKLLSDLVRTNLSVEAAFTLCACKTGNEQLCAMLLGRALVYGHAVRELTKMLNVHGNKLGEERAEGKGTPDWIALHTALVDNDDAAVREECARIEDETFKRFRDLLEHDLPADIRGAVSNQCAALLQHRGQLRELRLSPEQRGYARRHYLQPEG